MIVDVSMFVGDRNVPNSGNRDVMERLNWFINKYEPICLKRVLGYDLYFFVSNPYTTDSPIDKLINGYLDWQGLAPLIVDYVYYFYMADDVASNTGKGVVIPQKDTAYNISPAQKMIDAWNSFSLRVRDMVDYMTSESNYYLYNELFTSYQQIRSLYSTSPINEFDI